MSSRKRASLKNLGMVRAFGHRDFAIFAAGNFAGALGFWVLRITLQWQVWEQTKSFEWLGTLALVQALTMVAAMPVAGTLVDKNDRLKYGKTARAAEVLIALIFTSFFFAGFNDLGFLFAFAGLISFADGMWSPARLAILSALVPREDYSAAFGTSGALFYASQFIGPAIAGILILRLGASFAFLFQAILFVLSLIAFLQIRTATPAPEKAKATSFAADLAAGVRYTLTHRTILLLMITAAVVGLSLRSLTEILAGFADELFNSGAEGLATLASTGGIFALIAALYIGNFSYESGQGKRIIFGVATAIIAFAISVTTQNFQVAVMSYGILMFCVIIAAMSVNILIQNSVSEHMRGRVMSLWSMVHFATPSIGAWIIGLGAGAFGLRNALYSLAALAGFVLLYLISQRSHLSSAESTSKA